MWFAAAALLAAAAAAFAILSQRGEGLTAADAPGLPATYAMACRACNERFNMPAIDFRRALTERSNKTANRIRCPRCNADDAAYRRDSGMEGLGELNPDGTAAYGRRMPLALPAPAAP